MKPTRLPHFLAGLLLLLTTLVFAQPYHYQVRTAADGTKVKRKEVVPNYFVFDEIVSTSPSDAVPGRWASRFMFPYTPEPIQSVNLSQFGLTGAQKYFAPTFRFYLDYLGYLPVETRRKVGINGFHEWAVSDAQRSDMQPGEGMVYSTENFLGSLQGAAFHLTTLQEFLSRIYYNIPALGYGNVEKFGLWVMNLEASVYLDPGNYQDPPYPGYSSGGYFDKTGGGNGPWENWSQTPMQMESSPEIITFAQLASRGRGSWEVEMHTRRANRLALMLEICKRRSKPGTRVSVGTPMFVGLPRVDFEAGTGYFMDGYCKVQYIGGNPDGYITLNVPGEGNVQFRLNGDAYTHQDSNQAYWYNYDNSFKPGYEQRIMVDHEPALMNYPAIWAVLNPIHVMAEEKGYWQENRRLSQARQGYKQSQLRQVEPMYEFGPLSPLPAVQNIERYGPGSLRGTPKLWQPPYEMYSRLMIWRFLCGADPGSGFFVFPDEPPVVSRDLATDDYFKHHLHTISAMLQARKDMQPYENYYPGSTLVEDPEVQVDQTGSWQLYNGVAARNYNGGQQGPMRPSYSLRYKAVPGGWRVLVVGGMKQDWGQERIDLIRVPGSGLNGNVFKVKLRGPSAQCYEFLVSGSDSNQVYEALPTAVGAWEKNGYSGRIVP